MEPMKRRNNSGGWDGNKWRIKGEGLSMSPRQLAEFFPDDDVPLNKTGSKKYWERYLEIVRSQEQAHKRKESQHQTLIKSLDNIIESLTS